MNKYIKNAWEAYKNNFRTIVGAYVLAFLSSGLFFLLGFLPFFNLALTGATVGEIVGILMTTPLYFIFSMTMFLISFMLLVVLQAGLIQVFADSLKGNRAKIKTMYMSVKDKIVTILLAQLMVLIIMAIVVPILLIPTVFLPSAFAVLSVLLTTIILLIVSVFFVFVPHSIVLSNKGVLDALRNSFAFGKKNFRMVIILMLLSMIINWISGIIFMPWLNILVTVFLVLPIFAIAYTSLYLGKTKRKAKKVRK